MNIGLLKNYNLPRQPFLITLIKIRRFDEAGREATCYKHKVFRKRAIQCRDDRAFELKTATMYHRSVWSNNRAGSSKKRAKDSSSLRLSFIFALSKSKISTWSSLSFEKAISITVSHKALRKGYPTRQCFPPSAIWCRAAERKWSSLFANSNTTSADSDTSQARSCLVCGIYQYYQTNGGGQKSPVVSMHYLRCETLHLPAREQVNKTLDRQGYVSLLKIASIKTHSRKYENMNLVER